MARDAIKRLNRIEAEAAKLRERLGCSDRNEVVWQGDVEDRKLVVTANGFGGAELELAEGNHPVDYQRLRAKSFGNEDDACAAANRILLVANGEDAEEGDEGKALEALMDEIFG
jgi:hypothetical protein